MPTRLPIRRIALVGVLAVGVPFAVAACGDDDDDSSAGGGDPVEFTVTVENVSTPGTVDTDRADGVVPLSPGPYAVFEGEDPLFTPGEPASSGTRLLAEDGFPGPQDFIEDETALESLEANESASDVGVFTAPEDAPMSPAIVPGQSATFTVMASEGERLQIETMFVQSSDWFYAFGDGGLELFADGEPVSGDVTDQIALYDAGTEEDAAPGAGGMMPPGPVQKPVQGPMDVNVGTDEEEPVQLVSERSFDFDVPETSDVISVTLTPAG